jgi:PKD repeat protein
VLRDANLKAARGRPYVYNALGRVGAFGPGPITYGVCGGPSELAVDALSGNVRWTPSAVGAFSLCVLARNAHGEDRYTFTVDVVDRAPTPVTAGFTATPTQGKAVLAVTFDGSASSASADALPLMWRWDFGDGSPVSASGPTVLHRYVMPGSRRARLTVVDAYGAEASADATVLVQDGQGRTPPRARLIASRTSGRDAMTVDFSCDCAKGSSEVAAYRWELGNGEVASGTTARATYGPGRYHVVLHVVGADGLVGTDRVELVVSQGDRLPPECRATANPAAGQAPLTTRLVAQAGSEQGGVAEVKWELAPGTSATGMLVEHRYAQGRHAPVLRVKDDVGLMCTDSVIVHAMSGDGRIAPTILSLPTLTATCGVPYQYGTGGSAGAEGTAALHWGLMQQPSRMTLDASSGALTWTPRRTEVGRHAVGLMVSNDVGTAEQRFEVEVTCPPPRRYKVSSGCSTTGTDGLPPLSWVLAAGGLARWFRRAKRAKG